jgi:hypothetical protein
MSLPYARLLRASVAAAAAILLTATAASAQDTPLAGLLLDLLSHSGRNSANTATGAPIAHQMHFIPGLALELAPRELNKAIASQLTTFPMPSSSGGFAFTKDPATGEVRLTTSTFGPAYADRALTIGKGRFDFGLAFQPVSFDSFETAELTGGEIKFFLEHNNCCPGTNNAPDLPTGEGPAPFTPEFERDLLRQQISLDIETNTTVFFANYGVTDNFDVGAAVPIVSVKFGGSVTSTIERTATGGNVTVHSFDGQGETSQTLSQSRSVTGLGDILLRGKYNFIRSGANAVAASLDLRLPTGDEDELLGTGATQTKLLLLASGERGILAPHAYFGYTFSNGDVSELTSDISITVQDDPNSAQVEGVAPATPFDPSMPDEINYGFGISAAAHPRVTLGFDFIGRTIRDVFRFDIGDRSFPNRTPGAIPTASFSAADEFLVRGDPETGTRENLNLLLGVIGGKVNIGRGLLVNAGVLFPMTNSGLQPKVTPFLGLDYVF